MKTLENKTTSISGEHGPLKYSDLARTCISAPQQGGFGPDEMRKRLRLLDRLDQSDAPINLEDADAECLQQVVKDHRWPVINKDLLQFCDDVAAMPIEED